ncbi:MAG: hypothetical protein KF729_01080 [Sandaracinaceae bacterium]|nr:hypothetical protein [Sandaracinaceae bacterium]
MTSLPRRTFTILARSIALGASLAALGSGCDGPGSAADGGLEPARVSARFEPTADPIDFGAIPFPDDLYLDDRGRVDLGRLPSEDSAFEGFPDHLRTALRDLDGFSALAPIFFYFPAGALDPSSLPASPSASTREDSAVLLVDADSASPTAFRRLPFRTHWHAALGQLALRPYEGHPLMPGRRYAAVVTTRVRDDAGAPIGPAPRFAAIRDATARPIDPVDAAAYDEYGPVLSSLASNGVPRERVAAIAVFTVQTVARDLADARALVWSGEPEVVALDAAYAAGAALDGLLGVPELDEPGLDVPGGVAHRNIGWLVQGRFASPWLISDTPRVHGRFRRDAAGALVSTLRDEVYFTLTLPAGATGPVPLVIYQHGLGGERSSMLSVADALAATGTATIAIDIPYHGMRAAAAAPDVRHNFGSTSGPDGFGEVTGSEIYLDYLGVVDTAGEFDAFHPNYPRDALRQSVVDLMALVRLVRAGDWSAVRAQPGLEGLELDAAPIGFVGVSLGGILGTTFVASEPEIGAAVLNVTGGDLVAAVERSPAFAPQFLPILLPRIGLDPGRLDSVAYPAIFHPELAIVSTLLDRGDSMAFAPILAGAQRHLLFQMAEHDETLPNSATEALARATRAPILDAAPVHTDLAMESAPVGENVEVGAARFTRGLYRFAPATHGLLSSRGGAHRHAHPVEPPFMATAPRPVTNPVAAALGQAVHFLQSWRAGSAEIDPPPE